MTTIKTNTKLKNFRGETLKENGKDIEIGMVLANILGGITSNPSLAWVLGKKFATEKEVSLKAEEVVFVKSEIEKVSMGDKAWLSSTLAGQILEMVDGK